jgi:DNA-directed RNA polymerase subunit RPC12/RpoP
MPNYEFICSQCKHEANTFFHCKDYHGINCPYCGTPMDKNYKKMIPAFHCEQNDSVDFNLTGHPIVYHTKGQLKEEAKKRGCTLWE